MRVFIPGVDSKLSLINDCVFGKFIKIRGRKELHACYPNGPHEYVAQSYIDALDDYLLS